MHSASQHIHLSIYLFCIHIFKEGYILISLNAKRVTMTDLFTDLQIHINGQHTFFLNEKVISRFSGKLRKIIKQEKRKTQIRGSGIDIDGLPGGAEGFELVSRFCYNNGNTEISVSNVCLLHCSAAFLGMTEQLCSCNLLQQTEVFLEGMFYWSWNDVMTSLKSCESFFSYADSCGIIQKLIHALLGRIAQNSGIDFLASSSSTSSSPETTYGFRLSDSSKASPELIKQGSISGKAWWFEDMTVLRPNIIEKFLQILGAFGTENNNLVLTRFLLHYLKSPLKGKRGNLFLESEYSGLADTAVYGVITIGKKVFSCRALFWVLRIVTGFGLSRENKSGLEKMIAGMLDQTTLDDLLVSGKDGGVYDVNLVVRLIRLFVHHEKSGFPEKTKKVGRLIDQYLGEIAPDQNLKVSKFLGVAESLPDCARDCYDGVYRAIDIYLESHHTLSLEERSRICRCLNYEKLSLEACKDLAKNPKIPPRVAVQALVSQRHITEDDYTTSSPSSSRSIHRNKLDNDSYQGEESEDMKQHLQRMKWKVVELEKVCKQMRSQMSRMVDGKAIINPVHSRGLPRLC
ncbi:hypothetical protein Leryth_002929 [Lithospermum erythrorhizon]|nr:hypothetical protein Leryth_002929 [Lithospermum erythrorhizon]